MPGHGEARPGEFARRQATYVPRAITFATKPQPALAMIERALRRTRRPSVVTADSID
jgi:SRSO17 transposase